MSIFAKIFIGINIFYAAYGTFYMSKLRTGSGSPALSTPGGLIPAWQGIGVGLVIGLDFSPWHLIWWWPIGIFFGANLIRKTLNAIGI